MDKSLVMLSALYTHKNLLFPWQINEYAYSRCSGFCIKYNNEKYIMTNAHCVSNDTIDIYNFIDNKKYIGNLEFKTEYFDLAIYKSELCDKLTGLEIEDNIPNLGDKLYTYSVQSHNINVDVGIFRSLELVTHTSTKVLSMVLDGMVFPGDSGAPVLNTDNKVVGVLYLGIYSNNLGWCIAAPVIHSFL